MLISESLSRRLQAREIIRLGRPTCLFQSRIDRTAVCHCASILLRNK